MYKENKRALNVMLHKLVLELNDDEDFVVMLSVNMIVSPEINISDSVEIMDLKLCDQKKNVYIIYT